jgi:hypothetical protein
VSFEVEMNRTLLCEIFGGKVYVTFGIIIKALDV